MTCEHWTHIHNYSNGIYPKLNWIDRVALMKFTKKMPNAVWRFHTILLNNNQKRTKWILPQIFLILFSIHTFELHHRAWKRKFPVFLSEIFVRILLLYICTRYIWLPFVWNTINCIVLLRFRGRWETKWHVFIWVKSFAQVDSFIFFPHANVLFIPSFVVVDIVEWTRRWV